MIPGWLTSPWEPNWRSFQYFNLYRLVLASLFCLAVFFPSNWASLLGIYPQPILFGATGTYTLATTIGLMLSIHWQRHFDLQLSAQVMADIAAVSMLMGLSGGVSGGFGILLLVSLAAASLVGRGRLVLFYAAVATLVVLLSQIYGVLTHDYDQATIVHAGLMSAGFFATAILARLLGNRVMANEALARRRGVELDNQIRISQRVVERMQDGVLIVDRLGAVTRYNPVAGQMLGLYGQEPPVPLAPLVPELASALSAWQEGAASGLVRLRVAGGRELQVRFERTTSSDGEVLVLLEDLGRIKERAQEMKLAALGRLTASIAHEIRNPLSSIGHAGELLREERRSEMQDRLLRILSDNVVRLDRIVRDVLDLGRQSASQPEPIALDEYCASFVEQFVATEGIASEVLEFSCPEPVVVVFDRAQLNQVLWNLIRNALRHSRREAGSIRLRVLKAGSGQVELHVLDDGPGVPESVREQIFEPFFTTHTQGTGLGLYIARELCAANGARLQLAPALNGAHFIVSGRSDTCPWPEANDAQVAN